MLRQNAAVLDVEDVRWRRRGMTLSIPRLEIPVGLTVVSGENGAGKSTLLECLTFQHRRKYRAARWRDRDVAVGGTRRRYYAALGYAPQQLVVPSNWTVAQYLRFAGVARGLDRHEVATRLAQTVDAFELAPRLHDRIGTLSGGWKRRTLIAQAVLGDPEVLLLDEPLSGLDQSAVGLLVDYVRQRAQEDRALVAVDHSGTFRELTSNEIVLTKGAVSGGKIG